MSFNLEVNFARDCNQNPETCEVVDRFLEHDKFCSVFAEGDPDLGVRSAADMYRQLLGSIVDCCVVGNCPGQNQELFEELARKRREKR